MNDALVADASDELVFAEETEEDVAAARNWKLLVVDDDDIVHRATKLALADFTFEGRPLSILSAYSAAQGQLRLEEHADLAVVLLDVVMETDDAGLNLARYVRRELGNRFVRIILRTGQPGLAPEKEVITQFDINDYKEKTELTEQKLFTAITTALRAYRDLKAIEKNRKGLELIIGSTGSLFAEQRLRHFTEGVLTQLQSLLHLDDGTFMVQTSAFAASHDRDKLHIVAGTGKFHDLVDRCVEDVIPPGVRQQLTEAVVREESVFTEGAYVGFFKTDTGSINLVYLDGCHGLTCLEKDLIRTFASNVSIAYDRFYLSREILETQREVIEILGSVVEFRSNETADHVRRVAEFSYLLARKWGMSEREAARLKHASPMHDLGKIGIPDAILNKPGKLTPEEYEQIKTHTTLGYSILGGSKREIMKTAAIVAHEHHERWDGDGYPRSLRAEDIHVYGRITALADVFDALVSKRTYKDAFPIEKVVGILQEERGRQFDPRLVDLFLANLDEFLLLNRRFT